MTLNRLSLAFFLCLNAALPALSQPPAEPRALFDGQSLTGWEGDLNHWRVENGAIVGEIPPGQSLNKNTWLVWRGGELKDFDLRLQFRITGDPAANSGIQFRCQAKDVDHVSGYQADLDMGTTWLGRIYDEHGRALLVERGARVFIDPQGQRASETFAPAHQFTVLFRPNDWNDYRIIAVGDQVAVYVNGTLFSELRDQQENERDLSGQLALQLHSGPSTKVEFREIQLTELESDSKLLKPFKLEATPQNKPQPTGNVPRDDRGRELNLGFETGNLDDWTVNGNAFQGQPVKQDGIAARWAGQTSNKQGDFFIGGYEIVQDGGTGSIVSRPFKVTHPYASFLIGGGDTEATRVEIFQPASGDHPEHVLFKAVGNNREQMRLVSADLRAVQGQQVAVRVIDESPGAWGHINFDDFRFHDEKPVAAEEVAAAWRSTRNPLLQHLVPNPKADDKSNAPGSETTAQMFLPEGFSADVIAAEPDLHQPMAFTFDAKGRLWVVEGHCYPRKRPEGEGLDKVLIFTDVDGDGRFEDRKVFFDGLNLVSGMEVGHGGVWIGAAPELLFIPDRDGDDKPDGPPEVLLDGFGFADTHETLNSFQWGPDGWLYGNQGVFNASRIGKPGSNNDERVGLQAGVWRYHPTRHEFEVYAHGGSNQWGLDYDEHGQWFMTHCRSRWGEGLTTHVMQGGHYWNQVNGGYASFISASPLPGIPHLRNYLLASARYGHGEGGAGRPGSREVFGGHSHVGTMIYLGDNWPDSYRNHLFTHNLHGHQMNHQINVREAGGYNTVHAGQDVLFCADQQYIGVDLQYGPDGAVYISDWYDPRHCHNPNVEAWDRGNGRIYRVQFDATYKPVKVDLTQASDLELAQAQTHSNAWYGRMARLVLAERATKGQINSDSLAELRKLASQGSTEERLQAMWALAGVDAVNRTDIQQWLVDDSEYVRGWAIQLACDDAANAADSAVEILTAAESEDSLFVRRCLASALTRLPDDASWKLAELLASQSENTQDRGLTLLTWYGLAQLMDAQPERALAIGLESSLEPIRDYTAWYAAKTSAVGRDAVVAMLYLADADDEQRVRLLTLLSHAVRSMRGIPAPKGWQEIAGVLYDSPDAATRDAAETLGAAFGDQQLFGRMRKVLEGKNVSEGALRHALGILEADTARENLAPLVERARQDVMLDRVIPMLGRYNDPLVGETLIAGLGRWQGETVTTALGVLASRPRWANQLLDAIESKQVDKNLVTAFHARQMASLNNAALNERLTQQWGRLGQSSAETKHQIRKLSSTYSEAPLWAYDGRAGIAHFKKLCASCHEVNERGESIAPKLAGSGSKGIEYVVENILDPNAVIGRDFQARVIVTTDGRVVTGLVESESPSAVTVRTQTESVTIPRDDIDSMQVSENSFMPEGLLGSLNEREQIELLKYLMSL